MSLLLNIHGVGGRRSVCQRPPTHSLQPMSKYLFSEVLCVMTSTLLLTACSSGSVSDGTGPVTKPDTVTNPGGTVQRTSLTVRVTVDADDAALAARAGVSSAGLIVRLARVGASVDVRTAVTTADGTVRFEQLLEGLYDVSTDRAFTAAEVTRLLADDKEVSLLAAGTQVAVSPPVARDVQMALVASRRGSLAISEFYSYHPIFGNTSYSFGDYTEFTNLADTVIYMDGMLAFRDYLPIHSTFPEDNYCDLLAAQRLDTTAVWASAIYRFPGSGRQFPLQPGAAVVFAMDAINHGTAAPGLPDLSRASFEEFGLDGDVDNPFSVNMERLTRGSPIAVHGFPLAAMRMYGIALPIARDTTALVRAEAPSTGDGMFRIPRAAILDVVGLALTPEVYVSLGAYRSGWRECVPFGSSVFDRAPARLFDSTRNFAIRRKSLGRTASGIELLQRTRTGARDFELAPPLRRSLNK